MNCLKKKVKDNKKKVAGFTTAGGLITVLFFIGASPEEIKISKDAFNAAEKVILSQCFSKGIFESKLDLSQTNGLSHYQVVNEIREARYAINYESYYKNNNVIGYTYKSSDTIYFNRKFHAKYSLCEKVKNYSHELSHKAGFKHDVKATKKRPYSVPYIVGDVALKCCEEMNK